MSLLNKYFDITVCSHYFKLNNLSTPGTKLAELFAREFVQKKLVKVPGRRGLVLAPSVVWGVRVTNGVEYRFHIGQYQEFIRFASAYGVTSGHYTVLRESPKPGNQIDISFISPNQPRDYQVTIHDFILNPLPVTRKLVQIQTGKGKSFIAARAGAAYGKRIAIIIRPGYIEKWVEDMTKYYGISGDDVAVIQGTSSLMALLAQAKDGSLKAKIIIFSNKTFQNWIKEYKLYGAGILDMGYDCLPGDYCSHLGIGYRLVDEVHQDFHLNFLIDLFTNVELSVSLTATLVSDDSFVKRMQQIVFTPDTVCEAVTYDKYIRSYAYMYRVRNPKKIRTKAWGSTMYSHNAFEESISKDAKLLRDYLIMIGDCLEQMHTLRVRPDESALVYCSSVDMCTKVRDYLRQRFPKLVIERYVGTENDPYDNLLTADVAVSTVQSAGTGHDIAGLITVILTIAIMSTQSNIQGFGRLRNLSGKEMRFAYLSCQDIEKHVDYHTKKKELLERLSINYQLINYPNMLG